MSYSAGFLLACNILAQCHEALFLDCLVSCIGHRRLQFGAIRFGRTARGMPPIVAAVQCALGALNIFILQCLCLLFHTIAI